MNDFYKFKRVYIDNNVKSSKRIDNILDKISSTAEINFVDDVEYLIKSYPMVYHPQKRAETLLLTEIRGDILRKCPGTHGHIYCNYFVINLYIGCPINCSYCILQSYLNQPFTIINVDIENIFYRLDILFKENSEKIYRIGTGELGDSLAYDYITDFSVDFIDFFGQYKNVIFEFKTKTNFIKNIIRVKSPGNIVVGFSVNPDSVITTEEQFASDLSERITAMETLVKNGYNIALHLDPIVIIDNFMTEYKSVVDMIFGRITPKDIAWISLGTFRYPPELKNSMEFNYPD